MKTLLSIFASLALVSTYASAQHPGSNGKQEGWTIDIGAGALISPLYQGDNEYGVSMVPSIRASYGDRFFASVEGGIGYNVFNSDSFKAGPLAEIEFGRDEDGSGPFRVSGNSTDDLRGLGDIDTSLSLGGFMEYQTGKLALSLKGGKAVSGHEGLTGEMGLAYKDTVMNFGPPLILSFGPNIKFGNDTYMDNVFGVNALQSTASGLTPYAANGGITSYGASLTAIMPLTQKTSATLITSYDRLGSKASVSPLVSTRGSADQFFTGFILSYRLK